MKTLNISMIEKSKKAHTRQNWFYDISLYCLILQPDENLSLFLGVSFDSKKHSEDYGRADNISSIAEEDETKVSSFSVIFLLLYMEAESSIRRI